MKFAYIDSCVWITRIEGLPVYRDIISSNLEKFRFQRWRLCISDAVALEVLHKPYKNNNHVLIGIYNKLFQQTQIIESFRDVFKNALMIAHTENLNAIDAIHVSLAVQHGCKYFVSTDPHFKNLRGISSIWIDLSSSASI
jgi:predicted nucleic acid-binding protein